MRVAFGTVVYPAALKYQGEYTRSINEQIGREFDLLLVSDGLSASQRAALSSIVTRRIVWAVPEKRLSIPELRVELLRRAYDLGYDVLVLGDFDDTFAPERVSSIADSINEEFAFYYHNLDVEGQPLFDELPVVTLSIESIVDSNYLGFGNTAIRLGALSQRFFDELAGAPAVFDWFFFSLLLLAGFKGCLVPGSLTSYRLHDANTVGIQRATRAEVEKEIAVKHEHYHALSKRDAVFTALMEAYSVTVPSLSWWVVGPRGGRWWSLTAPHPAIG